MLELVCARHHQQARLAPHWVAFVASALVLATADPGDHLEALFAAADRALYDAKRAGRNCFAWFDEAQARQVVSILAPVVRAFLAETPAAAAA
mgnify:CR=1 FL=1